MKRTNLAAKICSLVFALAMALCCLPAAFAAEDEITVSFSFYDGAIVIPKTELTVTDGTAEKYGYTLSEMKTLIEKSGLTLLMAYDAFTHNPATEQSERIYMIAKENTTSGKKKDIANAYVKKHLP